MFAKAYRVLLLTRVAPRGAAEGGRFGGALAARSVIVWLGVILALLRLWTALVVDDPTWKLLPGHLLGWESFWRWCGAGPVPYLSCSAGTIHPAWLARGELFEVPASLI